MQANMFDAVAVAPAAEPVRLPLVRSISNSETKCWRLCRRKHHYAYAELRRPKVTADALRFGSLYHVGLNAWWLTGGDLLAAERALEGAASDPFELARARAMLLGYHARWRTVHVDEVIGVEMPFSVPLRHPVTGEEHRMIRLVGQMDAVARVEGKLVIVEHKTTSEDIDAGSTYWRRVSALDSQVSTYHDAAREMGFDVEGVLYDVVRKPGKLPLKATPPEARKLTKQGFLYKGQRETDETPEEYLSRCLESIEENPEKHYARGHIVRLAADSAMHALDVWKYATEIATAEPLQPRNPEACISYGRACEYLPICEGSTSIENDDLYQTVDGPHQELKR